MNVSKSFRMLILVFSFLMFIWQASVAISNLLNPPVVDSTERLDIGDIDPPLITICPLEQWWKEQLQYFNYDTAYHLFEGFEYTLADGYQKKFVGWGANHKLTFEQYVPNFVKSRRLEDPYFCRNGKSIEVNYEVELYPAHGYCYDLVNFTAGGELEITISSGKYEEAQVYITDKKLRTRNTVFTESQKGSKIILKKDWNLMT